MAQHRGELVLEAVKTTLMDLPTTGDDVYRMHKYNQAPDALPSINVVQGAEEVLGEADDGAVWPLADRNMEIFLEFRARETDTLEATLFQIEQEAITALRANRRLGYTWVHDTIEEGRGEIEEETIGDLPIGLVTKTIVVKYRTSYDDPGA